MKLAIALACGLTLTHHSVASEATATNMKFDLEKVTSLNTYISPLPSPIDRAIGEAQYSLYSATGNKQYLWESFRHGHELAIDEVYQNNGMFKGRDAEILATIKHFAITGNTSAQCALFDAHRNSRLGIKKSNTTSLTCLGLLEEFSPHNPSLQTILVSAYMNGDFGIKATKNSNKKHGRDMAIEYAVDNRDVQDLLISALRTNKLGFYSRRNYLPSRIRANKKVIDVIPFREVELVRDCALKGNPEAQLFLVECYMEGKYGADDTNQVTMESTIDSLLPFASENQDLQDLILALYETNQIGYKDKDKLHRKTLELKTQFGYFNDPDETQDLETEVGITSPLYLKNRFAILATLDSNEN